MKHHLMLNAYYTFAKNMNSVELDNNQTQGGAQNMTNVSLERSRADIDMRHSFSTSLTWQPEFSYNGNRALRATLNGWSISPIVRIQSGLPFTVTNGADSNLDGTNNDRAQLIGDPHFEDPSADMWFNTLAFRQNPAITGNPVDGNAGRNILDAPGFRTVDLAAFRTFRLMERFGAEFRAEGTNTFNFVNLAPPNSAVPANFPTSVGNFGKITTAGNMRQLQLGLRITF
jgi:hypothetical protein